MLIPELFLMELGLEENRDKFRMQPVIFTTWQDE